MTQKEQFELSVLQDIEQNEAFAKKWAKQPGGYFHQSSEAPYPVKFGWGYHDGVDVAPEDYDPKQGMTQIEFAAYRKRLADIGVSICWIPNGDVPTDQRYQPSTPDFVIDFSPESE